MLPFFIAEVTQPLECGAGTAVTPQGSAVRGSTKAPQALREEGMLSQLHKGSSSLIPSSGKGGDAVPAPQPGRWHREERQGFQGWLNLALGDGAKHGPRGRSAAQTLHTVGAASPTHVRPQKSQGRETWARGLFCSGKGRSLLPWRFLPSRLVSSTLICHQEERSSFLFIVFHSAV